MRLAALLIKVDLPTLGTPTTMARMGRPTCPFSFHRAICSFSALRARAAIWPTPVPARESAAAAGMPSVLLK